MPSIICPRLQCPKDHFQGIKDNFSTVSNLGDSLINRNICIFALKILLLDISSYRAGQVGLDRKRSEQRLALVPPADEAVEVGESFAHTCLLTSSIELNKLLVLGNGLVASSVFHIEDDCNQFPF